MRWIEFCFQASPIFYHDIRFKSHLDTLGNKLQASRRGAQKYLSVDSFNDNGLLVNGLCLLQFSFETSQNFSVQKIYSKLNY